MTWNAYNTATQSKQYFVPNLADSALIWFLIDYAIKSNALQINFAENYILKQHLKKLFFNLNDICVIFMDMFLF